MTGPVQTQIIFVPGAGPDFGKSKRPAQYRHHRLERWGERREIPQHEAERIARKRLAEELCEQARRLHEQARPQVEAQLAQAKALMAQLRVT